MRANNSRRFAVKGPLAYRDQVQGGNGISGLNKDGRENIIRCYCPSMNGRAQISEKQGHMIAVSSGKIQADASRDSSQTCPSTYARD